MPLITISLRCCQWLVVGASTSATPPSEVKSLSCLAKLLAAPALKPGPSCLIMRPLCWVAVGQWCQFQPVGGDALLARNASTLTGAPITHTEPHRGPVLWLDQPLWFLHDLRTYFNKNLQGTLRNKTHSSQLLEGLWCTSEPHSKVTGGVSGALQVHSLQANVKCKSGNEAWEGEVGSPSLSVMWSLRDLHGWGGLVPYPAVCELPCYTADHMSIQRGCLWSGCLGSQRLHVRHSHCCHFWWEVDNIWHIQHSALKKPITSFLHNLLLREYLERIIILWENSVRIEP